MTKVEGTEVELIQLLTSTTFPGPVTGTDPMLTNERATNRRDMCKKSGLGAQNAPDENSGQTNDFIS
jgi:hypothetical protein